MINTMNYEKSNNIFDELKKLTLIETVELIKQIEKFCNIDIALEINPKSEPIVNESNVNLSEPMEEKEEKTSFEIILTVVPQDKKIPILKVIKQVSGLGLKEAKELIDNVPKSIVNGITFAQAQAIANELEALGAIVTIS